MDNTPFLLKAIDSAIIGAIVGLIPLIAGLIKRRYALGVTGFVLSILATIGMGLPFGIAAGGSCASLMFRKPKPIKEDVSSSSTANLTQE